MTIYYRDALGIVGVEVDLYDIQFLDGDCYFSSNGEEYRVKIEHLVEIVRN